MLRPYRPHRLRPPGYVHQLRHRRVRRAGGALPHGLPAGRKGGAAMSEIRLSTENLSVGYGRKTLIASPAAWTSSRHLAVFSRSSGVRMPSRPV